MAAVHQVIRHAREGFRRARLCRTVLRTRYNRKTCDTRRRPRPRRTSTMKRTTSIRRSNRRIRTLFSNICPTPSSDIATIISTRTIPRGSRDERSTSLRPPRARHSAVDSLSSVLNRYIKMNPNFEHLNRVYEPKLTTIEKQRYKRCLEQQQQKLHRTVKKFDFHTADGHGSHYFLTGARYNRFDTVDSKILHKYGTFVNRNNPEQVEIKASHFKKFREILQVQRRASTGDAARRDAGYDSNEDGRQDDLDALTSKYDGHASANPAMYGRRRRLPKIESERARGSVKSNEVAVVRLDPVRYADVASQMPEKRRSLQSGTDHAYKARSSVLSRPSVSRSSNVVFINTSQ